MPLHWHMAKATIRIPDYLLEVLRERSREEERSLNLVTIDVIKRGLGHVESQETVQEILGDLIVKPAIGTFDLQRLREQLAHIDMSQWDLQEALDWTREDRI
jgi:hypothetical protein